MKKWQGDDVTFLKGLDKVQAKLEKMRDSFAAAAQKKRDQRAAKLGDYQTEDAIQNAYGYAEISDDERVALLLLLQESKETLVAEDAAVFYINAILRDHRLEREGWVEDMERKSRQKK